MSTTVKPSRPTRPVRPVLAALRDRAVRLAELATTPLLPADYLDLVHPLRSGTDLRGRVESVTRETADAATLVIRPGADWAGHVPGQYVRVGVDVDGVRQWRTYSITSELARADRCISITVKAVPGGVVSTHLVHRTRPGTLVHLDQATGEFVLPAPLPAKTLFVTAGSGITPVMGMLRNHLAEPSDVVVVHSSPTPDDVVFGAELRALAASGAIRLVERHTRTDGHLDAALLTELVPDLAERSAWACGPLPLLDLLEEHWATAGLGTLHVERFRTGVVVTGEGEGGTVSFGRTGTAVEADGATSILDAAESAGVLMPSGCRMGICFGCVLPLREGAVRDLRNGELTVAAPGDGVLVQTCISAAAGACDIDH
ncbi:2Fe-2S iron-sulfur cluster binding domain-containing protein [Modestobacter sp. I12A-02628]|uniref:Ferredoxin reductase n=1 Tax=Goekera deserti TaxID=2497753 RepID=A0A7K3WHS7_9ACTN|nr:ferredoxin reductase [Goekera deserti]MPQ99062.1 2Fe-2S iron-sulfur cluster binding domain-containing protein [Goekera deserti]NDI47396.1 2Fe-2S iron-sulfur cluster binding domain-containing protein [Goekera deserti]NEL55926.1 ferredoxin reductase [Goekera deserti]